MTEAAITFSRMFSDSQASRRRDRIASGMERNSSPTTP
jgi:hypothetical protein